ncbi:MAG: rsfS [Nevskia sp.]|nr:rsfS [Nevskia sp.]
MKTPPKTKPKSTAKPAAKPRKTAGSAVGKKSTALNKRHESVRKAAPKSVKKAVAKKSAANKTVPLRKPSLKAASDPALTKLVVAALEDLKAVDIKVLDVRDLTVITDTMVICTGTSNRHVKSLAQNVLDEARAKGFRPIGIEGLAEGEWVLVNLNGVLVHVMQLQTRAFYQLEKLWDMGQISDSRNLI